MKVEEGDVSVKSLYVEDCCLSVGRGKISLGQVHQSLKVDLLKGGLSIG